jgi:hypothetical protein
MVGHSCDDIPCLHRISHGIASAPSPFLPFSGTSAVGNAHDRHGHDHTAYGKPQGSPFLHIAQRDEAKVLDIVQGKPRPFHTFLDTRGVLSYLLPNVFEPMDPMVVEASANLYEGRCRPSQRPLTRRMRSRIDAKTLQQWPLPRLGGPARRIDLKNDS